MIEITNKSECCGCQACVEKCPQNCISLQGDAEGFLYPIVDSELCLDCHLCEKVCPVINKEDERSPIEVYAAINRNDKIRYESSSGGVFTLLAEEIIKQEGVVFGAKWNSEWEVEHGYSETIEGLKDFRGSKYVQSNINGSYSRVECFLKKGRKVLFTGTPCQIAGLRLYLKKDYENLLLVDCICHGVPSPGVFRQYLYELHEMANLERIKRKCPFLKRIKKDVYNLTDIVFRDKRHGWNNYYCTFIFSSGRKTKQFSAPNMKNVYFRGFNSDLFSRPSCYACSFRGLRSGSDITLGDFWGINEVMPTFDDNKGVGAVIINTLKGKNLFNSLDIKFFKSSYDIICHYNHSIIKSDPPHSRRSDFFAHNNWSVHHRVYAYCLASKTKQIFLGIKSVLKKWMF